MDVHHEHVLTFACFDLKTINIFYIFYKCKRQIQIINSITFIFTHITWQSQRLLLRSLWGHLVR